MRQLLFYAIVVLVMPYLTVVTVDRWIGGFATFVGFATAVVCIGLSAIMAQLASFATGLLRLVRKIFGNQRSLEAPPSTAEKVFFVAGPIAVALVVYSVSAIGLSFWIEESAAGFIAIMLAYGVAYGGMMAYGLLNNLVDIDDIDAAGISGGADQAPDARSSGSTKSH